MGGSWGLDRSQSSLSVRNPKRKVENDEGEDSVMTAGFHMPIYTHAFASTHMCMYSHAHVHT